MTWNDRLVAVLGKARKGLHLCMDILLVFQNIWLTGEHGGRRLVIRRNINDSQLATILQDPLSFCCNTGSCETRDLMESVPERWLYIYVIIITGKYC